MTLCDHFPHTGFHNPQDTQRWEALGTDEPGVAGGRVPRSAGLQSPLALDLHSDNLWVRPADTPHDCVQIPKSSGDGFGPSRKILIKTLTASEHIFNITRAIKGGGGQGEEVWDKSTPQILYVSNSHLTFYRAFSKANAPLLGCWGIHSFFSPLKTINKYTNKQIHEMENKEMDYWDKNIQNTSQVQQSQNWSILSPVSICPPQAAELYFSMLVETKDLGIHSFLSWPSCLSIHFPSFFLIYFDPMESESQSPQSLEGPLLVKQGWVSLLTQLKLTEGELSRDLLSLFQMKKLRSAEIVASQGCCAQGPGQTLGYRDGAKWAPKEDLQADELLP